MLDFRCATYSKMVVANVDVIPLCVYNMIWPELLDYFYKTTVNCLVCWRRGQNEGLGDNRGC